MISKSKGPRDSAIKILLPFFFFFFFEVCSATKPNFVDHHSIFVLLHIHLVPKAKVGMRANGSWALDEYIT